jgi:hypothetical protein
VNRTNPGKEPTQQASLYRRANPADGLLSGGYCYSPNPLTEVTHPRRQSGEHRASVLPSRPEPLTGRPDDLQQASDDHRLEAALRSIYDGPWLRTGGSKGGMQATYHKKFYPGDVDGLIAYVAPNDVIDWHDSYAWFLDHVGADPQCRANLAELQRQALLRRDEIVPLVVDYLGSGLEPWAHTFGSPDKAFEMLVLEMPFTFWQVTGQDFCEFVPLADASTFEIFDFLDLIQSFFFWTDEAWPPSLTTTRRARSSGIPRWPTSTWRAVCYPGSDIHARSSPRDRDAVVPVVGDADVDFVTSSAREDVRLRETDHGVRTVRASPFSVDSYVPRRRGATIREHLPAPRRIRRPPPTHPPLGEPAGRDAGHSRPP